MQLPYVYNGTNGREIAKVIAEKARIQEYFTCVIKYGDTEYHLAVDDREKEIRTKFGTAELSLGFSMEDLIFEFIDNA